MGRKPIGDVPKDKIVPVRLTEAEHAAITRAAGSQPLSTWLRELALREAAAKKRKRKS